MKKIKNSMVGWVVGWLVGFKACQHLLGYFMPRTVFCSYNFLSNLTYQILILFFKYGFKFVLIMFYGIFTIVGYFNAVYTYILNIYMIC